MAKQPAPLITASHSAILRRAADFAMAQSRGALAQFRRDDRAETMPTSPDQLPDDDA